jgi:hypothetical protein
MDRSEFLTLIKNELPASSVQILNRWLERGDGVAIYENQALDSSDLGHKQFISFGSPAAQIEDVEPPQRLPDIGNKINWRYSLIATYRRRADRGARKPVMADTYIPVLVGHARKPFNLQVTRSEDNGQINLIVRGMISLSLNGFLLAGALRDAGCPDVDLLNEILEDAELVDDDRLREITQVTNHDTAQAAEAPVTAEAEKHDPDVVSYTRARGPHPRLSYAWCTCGWRGPDRDGRRAAYEDVGAHLKSPTMREEVPTDDHPSGARYDR